MKAYIIIDLQNDYFAGGKFELVGVDAAAANAALFLEYARSKPEEYLLIHVRHVEKGPDAPFFKENTGGSEINDSVKPKPGELVITKNEPNSFIGTPLQHTLDSAGIKELVIAGAMTNICVQGTTRAAAELGYKVTLLKDAVATRDWEYDGKKATAEQVNVAVFATLAFGYADLVATKDAIL